MSPRSSKTGQVPNPQPPNRPATGAGSEWSRAPFFDSVDDVPSSHATLMERESYDPLLLLEAAQAGDAEAFGELCRTLETRLLRQAFTLCRDTQLAEDLAQDTLVEAWRSLHRYNGKCELFTWLCAILLNHYRNSLRKKRVEFPAGLDHRDANSQPTECDCRDSALLPDEAAESRENALLVQRCVRQLPAKHQQVIFLRFFVDDSLEGIAAALGCSVGTVKSRLFHALDKLRAMKALVRPLEHHSAPGARHESV